MQKKYLQSKYLLTSINIIVQFYCRNTMNRPLKPHDFVCSDHFQTEDYLTGEENVDKRGRLRTRRTLRPLAFPTIFPYNFYEKKNHGHKSIFGMVEMSSMEDSSSKKMKSKWRKVDNDNVEDNINKIQVLAKQDSTTSNWNDQGSIQKFEGAGAHLRTIKNISKDFGLIG